MEILVPNEFFMIAIDTPISFFPDASDGNFFENMIFYNNIDGIEAKYGLTDKSRDLSINDGTPAMLTTTDTKIEKNGGEYSVELFSTKEKKKYPHDIKLNKISWYLLDRYWFNINFEIKNYLAFINENNLGNLYYDTMEAINYKEEIINKNYIDACESFNRFSFIEFEMKNQVVGILNEMETLPGEREDDVRKILRGILREKMDKYIYTYTDVILGYGKYLVSLVVRLSNHTGFSVVFEPFYKKNFDYLDLDMIEDFYKEKNVIYLHSIDEEFEKIISKAIILSKYIEYEGTRSYNFINYNFFKIIEGGDFIFNPIFKFLEELVSLFSKTLGVTIEGLKSGLNMFGRTWIYLDPAVNQLAFFKLTMSDIFEFIKLFVNFKWSYGDYEISNIFIRDKEKDDEDFKQFGNLLKYNINFDFVGPENNLHRNYNEFFFKITPYYFKSGIQTENLYIIDFEEKRIFKKFERVFGVSDLEGINESFSELLQTSDKISEISKEGTEKSKEDFGFEASALVKLEDPIYTIVEPENKWITLLKKYFIFKDSTKERNLNDWFLDLVLIKKLICLKKLNQTFFIVKFLKFLFVLFAFRFIYINLNVGKSLYLRLIKIYVILNYLFILKLTNRLNNLSNKFPGYENRDSTFDIGYYFKRPRSFKIIKSKNGSYMSFVNSGLKDTDFLVLDDYIYLYNDVGNEDLNIIWYYKEKLYINFFEWIKINIFFFLKNRNDFYMHNIIFYFYYRYGSHEYTIMSIPILKSILNSFYTFDYIGYFMGKEKKYRDSVKDGENVKILEEKKNLKKIQQKKTLF